MSRRTLSDFLSGPGKSLADFASDRGKSLADGRGKPLADFVSGRGKSLAYAGTALALTGFGTATVASASSSAPATGIASSARQLDIGDAAGFGPAVSVRHPAAREAAARDEAPTTTASKTPAHHAAKHAAGHAAKPSRVHVVRHTQGPTTWKQIRDAIARETTPSPAPGKLPLADRLQPGSPSGPQAYVPITESRMANATTIVRQALSRHMGLRSAVIAVATAMQESTLENLTYGDRDSEGLFQQRPSAGWGTPAQITDPVYAADAFLNALHSHQQADTGWAGQPLWENAQAVQDSGFPYAYAKWETQAAQLVSTIARHVA